MKAWWMGGRMVVGICVDEGLVDGWTDGGGDMCR